MQYTADKTFVTEVGTFYLRGDGAVVDNLNPMLVDMSWDSLEQFLEDTEYQFPGTLPVEAIAQAYADAAAIVINARRKFVDVKVIWSKVDRVYEYLQNQARAELSSTLK